MSKFSDAENDLATARVLDSAQAIDTAVTKMIANATNVTQAESALASARVTGKKIDEAFAKVVELRNKATEKSEERAKKIKSFFGIGS